MSAARGRTFRRILPFLFLALTLGVQIFIFVNSLQDGETSAAQSGQVVEIVRPAYVEILPKVNVPPTEENIHHYVRKTAHFTEFFALGVVSFLSVLFFLPAGKKKFLLLLSPLLCLLTAAADETIQIFSAGRGPQWSDVLLDFTGALAGILLTAVAALIVHAVRRKRADKRTG